MTGKLEDVEFVDRYTGTPHEGRPWLRGCFGDCEAMGVFPLKLHGTRPDATPEFEEAKREGRLIRIDEEGWAWLRCPDCHGTGTVSRWQALKRVPRLVANHWRLAFFGGPVDDRWGTMRFAFRSLPGELWHGFTWRAPAELRR